MKKDDNKKDKNKKDTIICMGRRRRIIMIANLIEKMIRTRRINRRMIKRRRIIIQT